MFIKKYDFFLHISKNVKRVTLKVMKFDKFVLGKIWYVNIITNIYYNFEKHLRK